MLGLGFILNPLLSRSLLCVGSARAWRAWLPGQLTTILKSVIVTVLTLVQFVLVVLANSHKSVVGILAIEFALIKKHPIAPLVLGILLAFVFTRFGINPRQDSSTQIKGSWSREFVEPERARAADFPFVGIGGRFCVAKNDRLTGQQ